MSYQTLAYLAYREDWVNREELAFLFWADETHSKARHNVRQLLKRLGKLAWLQNLEVDPNRVRWQVSTDVASFRHASSEGRWKEAIEVYLGTFLTGIDKKLSPDYESWLGIERSNLKEKWRDASLNYSQDLEQLGQLEQALEPLNKLLVHDTLDEEVVRQYMQLSLQTGQREKGLKVYKGFAEQLQDELDLEPTTLTQQLAETIRESKIQIPRQSTSKAVTQVKIASHPISAKSRSFIGRDLELSEISHLLSKPECRLLTLLGMGGIGKSSTALQAAEELRSRYPEGVYVVMLEPITTPAGIPAQLAHSLGIALQGTDAPLEQIKRSIAKKSMLIVLDNFEHLMEGVSVVSDMLEACPHLDLLITSRERLMLEEEWLLALEGLSFPETNVSLGDALQYDAVKLFVERAQRVRPNFSLGEEDLRDVLKICKLVEGSPLGLELAAVWIRAMPISEIAREIEVSLDFLESSSRNAKDRHQSLRATFEYSWQLLSIKEQDALKKLSVFRGGFKKDAASHVADASIVILAALLDKSLIRLTPEGRYERHPLIYQFTQDKLAEDEGLEAETKAKHANYFHAYLKEAEGRLETRQVKTVLTEMDEELDNLRVAWQHMLKQQDAIKLRVSSEALRLYFDTRVLLHDGLAWFNTVLTALNPNEKSHLSALGYAKQCQAHFTLRLGSYEKAIELFDEAIALLSASKDHKGLIWAYTMQGYAARYVKGRLAEREIYLKALPIARELGNKTMLIRVLCGLGFAPTDTGGWEAAMKRSRDVFLEALSLCHEIDNPMASMLVLGNLGMIYWTLDEAEKGKEALERCIEIARDLGSTMWLVEATHDLAYIQLELNEVEQAHVSCQEVQALMRDSHIKEQTLKMELLTGEVALRRNDLNSAKDQVVKTLQIATSIQNYAFITEAIRLCSQINMAEGNEKNALRYFALVMKHFDYLVHELSQKRNKRWWADYKARYSGESILAAEAWAKEQELETVVSDILREYHSL